MDGKVILLALDDVDDEKQLDAFAYRQEWPPDTSKLSRLWNSNSSVIVPILLGESVWCLMEVTQRVRTERLTILVFSDVKTSALKNQSGPFEDAFREHTNNKNLSEKTVKEWRDSLRTVAALFSNLLAVSCSSGSDFSPLGFFKMILTSYKGVESVNLYPEESKVVVTGEVNPGILLRAIRKVKTEKGSPAADINGRVCQEHGGQR
ncbi:hypothetical protein EJ110_NYTH25985 [Nymphaea thermarum]|nr:hypothetical protein EJ110_NYTH25985 [Nymphaea thermarum]